MGRLDDKVAVISGTALRTGRAAAMQFAVRGARVTGCDLDGAGSSEPVYFVTITVA